MLDADESIAILMGHVHVSLSPYRSLGMRDVTIVSFVTSRTKFHTGLSSKVRAYTQGLPTTRSASLIGTA